MSLREPKNLTIGWLKKLWNDSSFLRRHTVLSRPTFPQMIKNQKGSALVMAMFFLVIAVFLTTVGAMLIGQASKQVSRQNAYVAMAENVARAGISDAQGWFIRQNRVVAANASNCCVPGSGITFGTSPFTALPYTYADQAFEPQFNNTVYDTANASVGIVRDYPLDNTNAALATYFGHYEVWRKQSATAQPTTDSVAVKDVSGERLTNQVDGNGIVWSITCVGTVYKRLDKSTTVEFNQTLYAVPYNTPPNLIVASTTLTQEFRKLAGTMPLPLSVAATVCGAVYCESASQVYLKEQLGGTASDAKINGSALSSGVSYNAFVYDYP
jgi:Tfp pilus assembly protein PilX